jgi:hypothetical protein
MTYSAALGGVLVSYSDVRLACSSGFVLDELPSVLVDVRVNVRGLSVPLECLGRRCLRVGVWWHERSGQLTSWCAGARSPRASCRPFALLPRLLLALPPPRFMLGDLRRVPCQALVLSPRPGAHLVGRVNTVGAHGRLGLLVCGILNASVAPDAVPPGLVFDDNAGAWFPSAARPKKRRAAESTAGGLSDGGGEPKRPAICVGRDVRFCVERVFEAGSLISLGGTMLDAGSGPVLDGVDDDLARSSPAASPAPKKRRKTSAQ